MDMIPWDRPVLLSLPVAYPKSKTGVSVIIESILGGSLRDALKHIALRKATPIDAVKITLLDGSRAWHGEQVRDLFRLSVTGNA